MSSKSKQTSTTTQSGTQSSTQSGQYSNDATYGWETPPDTEDFQAYRSWQPQVDPSIAFRAGDAKRQLHQSFVNPLGGFATAQMQDALQRSGERAIMQDASQAFRVGQNDVNAQLGAKLATLAEMTQPRMVQRSSSGTTSGTSSGTSSGTGTTQATMTQPLMPSIIQGGAGIGAALL